MHKNRQFTQLALYSAWETIIATHMHGADTLGQSPIHKGDMKINNIHSAIKMGTKTLGNSTLRWGVFSHEIKVREPFQPREQNWGLLDIFPKEFSHSLSYQAPKVLSIISIKRKIS